MSPGLSSGARNCSTQARNFSPLIGPSNAQGATRPSCRSAPMKVVVFQWPHGTGATRRSPRGHRPQEPGSFGRRAGFLHKIVRPPFALLRPPLLASFRYVGTILLCGGSRAFF